MNIIVDINKLEETWLALEDVLHIKFANPDYDDLVSLMDTLVDSVGDNVQHPLANLLYIVRELVTIEDIKCWNNMTPVGCEII